MLAVLALNMQLLEDNGGTPGAVIADDTVDVGDTFFVEILADDITDPEPAERGMTALALDIAWDAVALELIGDFNPEVLSSPLWTSDLPNARGGSLDQDGGTIDGLRGYAVPSEGEGSPVGDEASPERVSLLQFRADGPVSGSQLLVTISEVVTSQFATGENLTNPATQAQIEAQTITVTADAVNQAPVAAADTYTLDEGATLTTTDVDGATTPADATDDGVLANDTDLDGDSLSATLVTGPSHAASFNLNANGTFTYVHDGSENFADSFTYTVDDGNGGTDTGTVALTITPLNDNAPVATDDTIRVGKGGTVTLLADGNDSVLDNDTDADLPHDTLTVQSSIVSGPGEGAITLNADGTFSYTHDGGDDLTDSFVYMVEDAAGNTDTATVTIEVTAPGIRIEKATNGEDADEPTGPVVTAGDTITWTYVLTNTGNVPLEITAISDDNGTPADDTDDFAPNFVDGDTNDDGLLDTDETWTYTATGTAALGQYANTATVTAEDADTQSATDDDLSHYLGVDYGIEIQKATNGEDADDAPGLLIAPDSDLTWTYTVTNKGTAALSDVVVVDDNGTPDDDTDDFSPTFVDGDENEDGLLDPDETWTYTAAGTAAEGQYANSATVTAKEPGETTVEAEDASHYFGMVSGIQIEKATNGEDADDEGSPAYLNVGDTVVWTYTITNTGNSPLVNVTVTDDQGVEPAYQSGDTNDNGLLDADETWLFAASDTAEAGVYENLGTVTADDLLDNEVSDTDPSRYFGVNLALEMEKSTNGEDADTGTGPIMGVGQAITWTYEVTNSGNTLLEIDEIVDDNGTPDDTSDDFEPTFASGDANSNGVIDAGETWVYEATGTAAEGQYANTAKVTAVDPFSQEIQATDASHYLGVAVGIQIEKLTNGEDADEAPGPDAVVGETVSWTYQVTTTHASGPAFDEVTVSDDNGTPDDAGDDFAPTFQSGDTNGNNRLDPGETWVYEATGTAAEGQYANTATVVGTPVDSQGDEIDDLDPLTASDMSHYTGVADAAASLAGRVWADTNDNGQIDDQELGLGGVTIVLEMKDGDGDWVEVDDISPVLTAADGSYSFENLIPGTYRLSEEHPADFLDGQDAAGSLGGEVGDDQISEIVIEADDEGTGYNFGERGLLPSKLSKRMYLASTPPASEVMAQYTPEPAAVPSAAQQAEGVAAYLPSFEELLPAGSDLAELSDAELARIAADFADLLAGSDDEPADREAAIDFLLALEGE